MDDGLRRDDRRSGDRGDDLGSVSRLGLASGEHRLLDPGIWSGARVLSTTRAHLPGEPLVAKALAMVVLYVAVSARFIWLPGRRGRP